jgi:hypothetical protein
MAEHAAVRERLDALLAKRLHQRGYDRRGGCTFVERFVGAVPFVALVGLVACARPVQELRSPTGEVVLETWCRSVDACSESTIERCPDGVEIVDSATDDDEGVCRVRFRCLPGAIAEPLRCVPARAREVHALREVERPKSLGLELDAGFGVAPGPDRSTLPAAALDLATVYRTDSAFAVAFALGMWPTFGSCDLSGTGGACDFPRWVRAAPQARWYFAHTPIMDASLIGEAGAFLAPHFDPAPLLGGGARVELVLGPVLLGVETRGGPALTPKPVPYFLAALSLGVRMRVGEYAPAK